MVNKILKRLTINNCGFDIEKIKEALGKNESVQLLKIVGISKSSHVGQTSLSQYLRLKGKFLGVNLITGKMYESNACILPNFIIESIADALQSNSDVEFGLKIGVKSKPNTVTGYEFTVKFLFKTTPNDVIEKLIALAEFSDPVSLNDIKASEETK